MIQHCQSSGLPANDGATTPLTLYMTGRERRRGGCVHKARVENKRWRKQVLNIVFQMCNLRCPLGTPRTGTTREERGSRFPPHVEPPTHVEQSSPVPRLVKKTLQTHYMLSVLYRSTAIISEMTLGNTMPLNVEKRKKWRQHRYVGNIPIQNISKSPETSRMHVFTVFTHMMFNLDNPRNEVVESS